MTRKKQPTLDAQTVRAQLAAVQSELTQIDERRNALLALLRGYEAWLRVFGAEYDEEPPARPEAAPGGVVIDCGS